MQPSNPPSAYKKVLEQLVVGDDAVVHDHKGAALVRNVWVAVGGRRRPMRGPASVRDGHLVLAHPATWGQGQVKMEAGGRGCSQVAWKRPKRMRTHPHKCKPWLLGSTNKTLDDDQTEQVTQEEGIPPPPLLHPPPCLSPTGHCPPYFGPMQCRQDSHQNGLKILPPSFWAD